MIARSDRLSVAIANRVLLGAAVVLSAGSLLEPLRARAETGSAETAGAAQVAASELVYPNGLAIAREGDLFISDIGTHRIFKLDSTGRLCVIAGTGSGGFGGDGGPATEARLHAPFDVLFDASSGDLLVADTYNHRVRRIDRDGRITTIAGNGKAAYSGDGGPAADASLDSPQSIALDAAGNLLIADTFNHVIRRVDRGGVITTIAGTEPGLSGDGGPAVKSQFSLPMAVAIDAGGNVYLSDAGNSRVRRVTPDGTIDTVIGFGLGSGIAGAGFEGDDGPPNKAKIFSAADLKFGSTGDLYISDSGNNRIRVVVGDVIKTLAGVGAANFAGDEGEALAAAFNTPQKIAIRGDGVVFIADRANHRVRSIDSQGVVHTIAGGGEPAAALFIYKPK